MKTTNETTKNTFPFENLPVEIKKLIADMVFFNNTKDATHFQLVSKAWYLLLDARIWKAYFFHLFPHIKLIKAPSKEENESQSFWKGLIKEAKGAYVGTINSINDLLIKPLFKAIYQNNPTDLINALNAISDPIQLTYFYADIKRTKQLQLPRFSSASFVSLLNRGLSLKQMYDYVLSKANQNNNALFWAAAFNQVGVIDDLTLTDWNTPAIDGRTPFFIACQNGNLAVVTRLLQKPGIEANKAYLLDGSTPLYVACYHGHLAIVKKLLKHKNIEVNQACKYDEATPLHVACQEVHVNIVFELLLKGADLNAIKHNGDTPLAIAKRNNHAAIVTLLNLFSKLSGSDTNESKETLLLNEFRDYLASYRRQWLIRPILRFFGDSGKRHGDSIQEALNSAKLENSDNIDFKQFIDKLNEKEINAKETDEFYMLLKLANHYLDTKEKPSASIDESTPLSSPKPS